LNETVVIKINEEVMIKNQLLNVSFDDMVMEKNQRKMLMEALLIELNSLKE
jgi:hypothetical protein